MPRLMETAESGASIHDQSANPIPTIAPAISLPQSPDSLESSPHSALELTSNPSAKASPPNINPAFPHWPLYT